MSSELNLLEDIYYSDDYISLYVKEGEELFNFRYEEENKILINKTIKRPIIAIGNIMIDDGFYDLETAYGYGGFYTNSSDNDFLTKAFCAYEKKCKDENIIAEFIRFHPFNTFPLLHSNYLDFNTYDRDIVVVDLSEDILSAYRSKVRNTIKQAYSKVEVKESNNLDTFMLLYQKTMQKNNASEFYFFKQSLFDKLYNIDNVSLYEVIFDNEIVAMGFFMEGKDFMHYHLSANSDMSYKLNANYALLYALSEIAKKKKKKYFILGGGATPSSDDALLKFKKKFSNKIKPFYIAGKIYNKDVYDRYIKLWEEQSQEDIKYFSKYRLKV